jgi:chromatin remodeling complex protein RSC6
MSSKTATKKTAAAKKTEAPAAAPVVAAPVVAAPAPVVAAPVAAAAPAEVVAAEEINIVAEFNGMVEKVNSLRSALAAVFSDMKKLEKRIPRELKKASKGRRNRKAAADGTDKPKKESVFTKPSQISDDLCVFLGKAKGTLMSRSEVTTAVCGYAKQKGLMDKQVIKADAALRKLLALSEKDELKILNLQRYLKPHYIKAAAPTA